MAVVNLKGSRIMTGLDTVPVALADPGEGGGMVRAWTETVETSASQDDSVSSTYLLARLPSNARILGASRLHWDDLATTGSPTFKVGIFSLSGTTSITDDDDALNVSLDLATATTGNALIADKADYGKRLWEFVNGQTVDPKCLLDIKGTLAAAALTNAATITIEVFYTLD